MTKELGTSNPMTYAPKQPLWYWTERGRVEAEFVKFSASGKRAYVRHSPNQLNGGWLSSGFVDPKNLEPRHED
jgi:hypothetical protein